MQPDRLPTQLARCDWGKNPVVSGRARPKPHTDVTSAIAARLGDDPATAAATPGMSAGAFKAATVKSAVRQTAMKQRTARHTSAKGRSTVGNYLAILGPEVQEFPNTLPHYLNTAMHSGAHLKLLYRAGFAPVAHTASKN
jgi:hypothetical protein